MRRGEIYARIAHSETEFDYSSDARRHRFSFEIIDEAFNPTHGIRLRRSGDLRHVTILKNTLPIVASIHTDVGRR
jgi:hypothetical protein